MSPRATDSGMRAPAPAAAPSPIVIHSHHQQGSYGRKKGKKPLSSGFKAIVWTTPPPVGTASTAPPSLSSQQRRESPRAAPSPSGSASSEQHARKTDFGPVDEDRRRSGSNSSGGGGSLRRSPRARVPQAPQQPSYKRQSSLGSPSALLRTEAEAARRQNKRLSYPPPAAAAESKGRAIGTARSEEFGDQLAGRALQGLPEPAALEGTGIESSTSHSAPHSRRPAPTDAFGHVVMERSLSDSSVVTASDFSVGQKSNNTPIILPSQQVSDEDAIKELVALLAKGKGLPVVKHATGMGGGKSRKLLKLNQHQGAGERHLVLCGVLPPYFKTRIPVQDVDRVEAKWCCVVVHARGRSPVRAIPIVLCGFDFSSCVSRGGLHACVCVCKVPTQKR